MRYCLMIEGQEGITWAQWLRYAEAAERLGFDGVFTSDHYLSVQGFPDRGSSDAWAILAALAARTERVRLGTLVSPVTFRHPSVLAKMAVTVDRISAGRVEISFGAGWWDDEHRTHGFPFPTAPERFDMLEEQLRIVHGLLTEPSFTFRGSHYTLQDCPFMPKAVQRPRPPIIVGAKGLPRGVELAARYADEFNTWRGTPAEIGERFGRVREAVDATGRDQATLTTSMMTWVYVGASEADARARFERARALDPDVGTYDESAPECVVGTPDQAAEQLRAYAAAGVQRVMLNHSLFDDVETLEILAAQVFPQVES